MWIKTWAIGRVADQLPEFLSLRTPPEADPARQVELLGSRSREEERSDELTSESSYAAGSLSDGSCDLVLPSQLAEAFRQMAEGGVYGHPRFGCCDLCVLDEFYRCQQDWFGYLFVVAEQRDRLSATGEADLECGISRSHIPADQSEDDFYAEHLPTLIRNTIGPALNAFGISYQWDPEAELIIKISGCRGSRGSQQVVAAGEGLSPRRPPAPVLTMPGSAT